MHTIVPDHRLALASGLNGMHEFPREFFRQDTARVARLLVGAWLARRHRGRWHAARIVETEAYLGEIDRAAHSWGGRRTRRVEPMYMDGGHLYVFLVYGMHHCANVVTRGEGMPEAILLRAAEGPTGCPAKLLSGPGRLCAALGITITSSGLDLLGGSSIRILQSRVPAPRIGITTRIGIDYAAEAREWPLRFVDLDSPALSGPRRNQGST